MNWKAPLLAVTLALSPIFGLGAADWEILAGCRLVRGAYADGDSFHVDYRGRDIIIRLYYVDTPETNRQVPSRIREQAEHFGVSEAAVMAFGKTAGDFSADALRSGTFIVHTRWEDARGASRQPRFYGHIIYESNGVELNLATELVRNGLARSYGMKGAPPAWPSSSQIERELDQLENRARIGKAGIYGGESGGESAAVAAPTPWRIDKLTEPDEPEPSALRPAFSAVPSASGDLVSINLADAAGLESVPGIGPVLAQRIIDARPFDSVDDLIRVRGIGETTLERVRSYVQP